jgi:predicted type IV restriction endonuclease
MIASFALFSGASLAIIWIVYECWRSGKMYKKHLATLKAEEEWVKQALARKKITEQTAKSYTATRPYDGQKSKPIIITDEHAYALEKQQKIDNPPPMI